LHGLGLCRALGEGDGYDDVLADREVRDFDTVSYSRPRFLAHLRRKPVTRFG